jgi:mRNA interferase RelE/StbE
LKKPSQGSEPAVYRVELRPTAEKDLDKLPSDTQERIFSRMDSLALNPTPPGCAKLKPEKNRYRIRVGDYRIVYRIYLNPRSVLVEFIRHRKDVYREMD